MPDHVPPDHFANAYKNIDQRPPWDIDRPQPVIVEAAEFVQGDVLDSGCGTGEHAIFFALRGHPVTAIDFLQEPLAAAADKAKARGANVDFRQYDALKLGSFEKQFDTVIDCGLFHVFGDSDRKTYVRQLAQVIHPGGTLLLHCFSDSEPGDDGPRRVSQQEIREAFGESWRIHSIDAARFIVREDLSDVRFSAGGPHAWLARIERSSV